MVVETGFSDFHKVSLTSMNALMKKITNVYLILSVMLNQYHKNLINTGNEFYKVLVILVKYQLSFSYISLISVYQIFAIVIFNSH